MKWTLKEPIEANYRGDALCAIVEDASLLVRHDPAIASAKERVVEAAVAIIWNGDGKPEPTLDAHLGMMRSLRLACAELRALQSLHAAAAQDGKP